MAAQGRLGDKGLVPADSHGCPACPHACVGPSVAGSPDTNVNGRAALRVGDPGVHAACCGPNTWAASEGSSTVFINGKPAHRLGDATKHCGGMGHLIEGSGNVFTGGGKSKDMMAAQQAMQNLQQQNTPMTNTLKSKSDAQMGQASNIKGGDMQELQQPIGRSAERSSTNIVQMSHDASNVGADSLGSASLPSVSTPSLSSVSTPTLPSGDAAQDAMLDMQELQQPIGRSAERSPTNIVKHSHDVGKGIIKNDK